MDESAISRTTKCARSMYQGTSSSHYRRFLIIAFQSLSFCGTSRIFQWEARFTSTATFCSRSSILWTRPSSQASCGPLKRSNVRSARTWRRTSSRSNLKSWNFWTHSTVRSSHPEAARGHCACSRKTQRSGADPLLHQGTPKKAPPPLVQCLQSAPVPRHDHVLKGTTRIYLLSLIF